MASDQNVADQTMTNNNLTLGTSLGATTQSSLAVTRSLDLEFEAEGPPPGFDNITTVSSQTVVTSPFLYMPSQLQSRELGGASGNTFTPATTTNAQASRLFSIPVITSASPSTIASQTSMPQYYQPLISNSMPPLYSAALTAALSTPPHQPVVMPAGIMNAPVTPGNQVYFPGYCYAPPYGYLPSYGVRRIRSREPRRVALNRHTRLTCRLGGMSQRHNRFIPRLRLRLSLCTTGETRSGPGCLQ